jgi:type VII secretion protein EccB
MATTREQAEAYNYEGRRQATSLMTGEDEARRDPRRRINRVTAAGVLVGVLVMAGFGIAGFLGAGRGPALPESGGVLVSGTGDRYVVIDKRLHPALNLSSALLVGGGSLTQVRAGALDALPRGLPVGIPDAPDALPQPDRLTAAPWTVCAVPSGAPTLPPEVTVGVGLPEPSAGRVEPGSAVVAVEGNGALWLLHDGRRYRLVDNAAVLLGLQAAVPVPLPNPLLDLLPEGSPIVPPKLPDHGKPAEGLPPQWVVGDVVRDEAGGVVRQSFAVLGDGLSPVSDLTAALLVASGGREARAAPAAVSAARQSLAPPPGRRDWPARVPRAVAPQRDQPLCLSTTPGDPAGDAPWTVRMSMPGVVVGAGQEPVHTTGNVPGVVDHIVIPRGAGALVRASTASHGDGALTLVTDSGQRYAVPSPDAAVRLRYDPATARTVPAPFVRLLPAGPALDPEVATREFRGR